MLNIRLIVVGKNKDDWVTAGCAHYIKLLSRFAEVSLKVLPAGRDAPGLSAVELKRREAKIILKELNRGLCIALADSGLSMDSHDMARHLEKWQGQCQGSISFIIGGAQGLDETVLSKADLVLSLSRLTFSHQLVRLVLLEQLYRAFSILHNTDYHK